jgi:hypothetical protein
MELQDFTETNTALLTMISYFWKSLQGPMCGRQSSQRSTFSTTYALAVLGVTASTVHLTAWLYDVIDTDY